MGGALGMRQSLHVNLDFYGVLLACLAYSMFCVAILYTYEVRKRSRKCKVCIRSSVPFVLL